MAKRILTKSRSKLYLSHLKTVWLQKTIKTGNHMAEVLRHHPAVDEGEPPLAETWNELMVELVEMML